MEIAGDCSTDLKSIEPTVSAKNSSVKPKGSLDHDPLWQQRANEIATKKMKETGRIPTRAAVAKFLAKDLGEKPETVERRIRKQW